MLSITGRETNGTITWMVGPRTLDTHIVPRIASAAEEAGRDSPRVCVGLPICVTDDAPAAFEAASGYFRRYGDLPSYRRMLDIEGVESPAEVAIIGDEAGVEAQLRAAVVRGRNRLPGVYIPGRCGCRRIRGQNSDAAERPRRKGMTPSA